MDYSFDKIRKLRIEKYIKIFNDVTDNITNDCSSIKEICKMKGISYGKYYIAKNYLTKNNIINHSVTKDDIIHNNNQNGNEDIDEDIDEDIVTISKKQLNQIIQNYKDNDYKMLNHIQQLKDIINKLKEENEQLNTQYEILIEASIKKENKETEKIMQKVTKYKKITIPKAVRHRVWTDSFGDTLKGNCYVCDIELDIRNFDCSHILAEKHGGQIIPDNLKVCCKPCNTSCGTMNLIEFKKMINGKKIE